MILIDGHNLIGSGLVPGIRLHQEDDEWRLVQWLRARQPRLHQQIVVVFDGGIPGGVSRSLSGGGVLVVFAAAYRTKADKVILDRVRSEMLRRDVVVVSNDIVLRQAVLNLQAQVLSLAEFMERSSRPQKHRRSAPRRQQAEPRLPWQEVEEWLNLFHQGGDDDAN
ncbi:MAG: NYN domain-containing protein [Chloroflexi bacterium]|nr:NYN domain-containing protein [Chloroflexota bacterium]